MAHPKRKQSVSRRNKRRANAQVNTVPYATCAVTGEQHQWHHAYWHENKLYYKGKVVMERGTSE